LYFFWENGSNNLAKKNEEKKFGIEKKKTKWICLSEANFVFLQQNHLNLSYK
jgi:hypothetical protein